MRNPVIEAMATLANLERLKLARHRTDTDKVSIGVHPFQPLLKIADEFGAVDFTVRADGMVERDHFGCPLVITEWIAQAVTQWARHHNLGR